MFHQSVLVEEVERAEYKAFLSLSFFFSFFFLFFSYVYIYCCLIIILCLRGIALTSLVPVSQTTAAARVHSAPWSCCRWSTGGDVRPAVGRLPSEGCITLMSGESHRCCSVMSVLIAHTQDTACYGPTDTPHCSSVLFSDVFSD